jgi:hypothetical protein
MRSKVCNAKEKDRETIDHDLKDKKKSLGEKKKVVTM